MTWTIVLGEERSSSSRLYGGGDACRREDVADRAGDGGAVLTGVAAAITWLFIWSTYIMVDALECPTQRLVSQRWRSFCCQLSNYFCFL